MKYIDYRAAGRSHTVALPTEGVEFGISDDGEALGEGRPPHGGRGLKFFLVRFSASAYLSPSPRRAWIEIFVLI